MTVAPLLGLISQCRDRLSWNKRSCLEYARSVTTALPSIWARKAQPDSACE